MNALQAREAREFQAWPSVEQYARDAGLSLIAAKAALMWEAFSENERAMVRFGIFPARQMHEAEAAGFESHALVVALMECAKRDGGMRA